MTTLTYRTFNHPTSGLKAVWTAAFERLVEEFRVWQATRSMQRLDESALHDIGVARGEIDDAVRYGRHR